MPLKLRISLLKQTCAQADVPVEAVVTENIFFPLRYPQIGQENYKNIFHFELPWDNA